MHIHVGRYAIKTVHSISQSSRVHCHATCVHDLLTDTIFPFSFLCVIIIIMTTTLTRVLQWVYSIQIAFMHFHAYADVCRRESDARSTSTDPRRLWSDSSNVFSYAVWLRQLKSLVDNRKEWSSFVCIIQGKTTLLNYKWLCGIQISWCALYPSCL